MKVQLESAKLIGELICVETKDSFVLLCEWISSNNLNGLNENKSDSTDSTMKSGKKSKNLIYVPSYEGFFNFRFENLKVDCKKCSNMTKCQNWKTNSRRGFYLCYWIIGVIFDTSQKFLDKWMSGIDFHGFLLVEVVITLHIMGFWMGLTSNNSLHISSPSKSGKRNVFDSKF